jgi:membrane-associated phospholipid phosphatase
MPKAVDRVLNKCKLGSLHGEAPYSAREARKGGTSRTFFWLVLSLGLLTLAFVADAPVARMLTIGSSTFLRQLALWASRAGEGWVIAAVGATVSLCLFFWQRFDASRIVFLVASTGLLTGAAATVFRSLLGRTRPTSTELQGFYGVWHDSHWIIGQYEFGAFPSGHAATVIGLAAAAWLLDRRFGFLAALYALLVSWSRIALACHHFSDTVAAGILGVYGAHLILARLGPTIYSVGKSLQNTWLARKGPLGSSGNPGQA